HTRSKRDWSSDVCSSDLELPGLPAGEKHGPQGLLPVLRQNIGLQVGKVRAELNQLLLLPGPKGFSGGEIGDGLQQVGLALGVVQIGRASCRESVLESDGG